MFGFEFSVTTIVTSTLPASDSGLTDMTVYSRSDFWQRQVRLYRIFKLEVVAVSGVGLRNAQNHEAVDPARKGNQSPRIQR